MEETIKDTDIYLMDKFKYVKSAYPNCFTPFNKQSIEHYLQSLSTVLTFIIESKLLVNSNKEIEANDRRFYISILISSQTLYERAIVYYHLGIGWRILSINDPTDLLREFENKTTTSAIINDKFLHKNMSHVLLLNKMKELKRLEDGEIGESA